MIEALTYPLKSFVRGIIEPGQLPWLGPWLPRLPLGWQQELWRELRPRRVRWGWAFLLAIVLLLLMGELSPLASAIVLLLR